MGSDAPEPNRNNKGIEGVEKDIRFVWRIVVLQCAEFKCVCLLACLLVPWCLVVICDQPAVCF
jgi:hypothetical protein